MGSLRLDKPWQPLTEETVAALPGQLGVYQLGDEGGTVTKIGVADARQPFGLRSALAAELATGAASSFRHECTHGYLTRWQELLMVYRADHGELPRDNRGDEGQLGRLSPGG